MTTHDSTLLPQLEAFTKLDRDLKKAATILAPDEARYLVDAYYAVQSYRIRFGNQIRALTESGEPHELFRWMYGNIEGLEGNVKRALDAYSGSQPVGIWARTVPGIGPVLASGLLAHIDIAKAPTAGHIWSYAGLNPEQRWEKGQKRPWNANLKRITFLIGESFVKVQSRQRDVYGHVFAERKKLEQEANECGFYADQAQAIIQSKRLGKETEAYHWYSEGKLPPAHLHARARRYAVKLFLAHLHAVWYEIENGAPPAAPYVLTHLGHAHYIKPPFWPLDEQAERDDDEVTEADEETSEDNVTAPDEEAARPSLAPSLATKLARWKEMNTRE